MAEFKEVMKQFNRMCDSHKWCDTCQINDNRGLLTCYRWLTQNPERAEEIVMDWAKKYPYITNWDKFKEIFGFDPYSRLTLSKVWFEDEYKEPKNE